MGPLTGLAEIEAGDALGERTPLGRPSEAGEPQKAQGAQPQRNPGGLGSRSPGDGGRMPKGSCFRLVACRRLGRPDRPGRSGRQTPQGKAKATGTLTRAARGRYCGNWRDCCGRKAKH